MSFKRILWIIILVICALLFVVYPWKSAVAFTVFILFFSALLLRNKRNSGGYSRYRSSRSHYYADSDTDWSSSDSYRGDSGGSWGSDDSYSGDSGGDWGDSSDSDGDSSD